MEPSINWTLICTLLLCVFCTVDSSDGSVDSCSTDGMSIRGGEYSLSNSTNVGSELLYHCPDGYYPSPYRHHKCLDFNGWYPRPRSQGSECKIMTCPDPMVMLNGRVSPAEARYEFGNQITCECDDGYTFRGSATRTCQRNGKWSGFTPICDAGSDYCSDPGVPPGADRYGNQFEIGDRVTYMCSSGLKLQGSKERTCLENGRWSGTEPACNSKHSYDTIEEVSKYFSASLDNRLSLSGLNYNADGQQVPKSVQMKQGGKLHIYIALDTSGSIGENNFTVAKKCASALIDKISYFEVIPKYGILSFASKVTEIVNILSNSSHEGLLEKVEKLSYTNTTFGTGSNLAGAFRLIHEKMAFLKEKDLKGTYQAIFMFTDGKVNVGGSAAPTVDKIRNLIKDVNGEDWQEYLDIYVFGVGGEVNDEEINKLVSKKSDERHSYKLRTDTELTSLFNKIIDESNSIGLCGLSWDLADDLTSSKRLRYPWLTAISITRPEYNQECMGALITPQFVLTAAHCFGINKASDDLSEMGISVKAYNQDNKLGQRPIIHPDYDIFKKKGKGTDEFYDYDVALLKLEKPVDISIHVRPICIPCTKSSIRAVGLSQSTTCKAQEEFLLNQDLVEARFMSESKGHIYNKDATIKLNAMRETCRRDAENAKGVQDYKEAVTGNFLCTGGLTGRHAEKVACKGDSGGALYLTKPKRHIQVGVISWGVVDLCRNDPVPSSTATSRDYHINLFRVQKFLKDNLGDENADYAPLKFVD